MFSGRGGTEGEKQREYRDGKCSNYLDSLLTILLNFSRPFQFLNGLSNRKRVIGTVNFNR